ncbi:DUF1366 domain-containing protein [Streptococcus uberis]|uniref:DUF1366 domain-containing protein n=1 Tax=Streptococcus uberis TaxID=1349 RepID=UPI0006203175|nr:DUF1366 domain-containing protein [Streptococcus uberis]KKF49692.1 hypothetical protein AF60_09320 [Streptococcus uberis S6261]MCK1187810.1 DUF1366 domain-containing protein [Streptococcus uberis]
MINNLKLEWGDKSLDYLNGEPYRTRVVLKNEDGAYYPVFFEPDAINKPDSELLQMALDVNYQKNSSGRAEDERFNLLGTKIAEVDKATEESKKATEDLIAQTERTKQELQDKIDNAVVELTTLITSSLSGTA